MVNAFLHCVPVFMCSKEGTRPKILAKKFNLKLVEGLVEIIKYTFSSLAGSNFGLLTCIYIGSSFVWKLDGTVNCFQNWQGIAALFLLFYTIPFSFSLALGTKLLKDGRISNLHFIFSCILPLPFCIIWLSCIWQNGVKYNSRKNQGERSKRTTGEI